MNAPTAPIDPPGVLPPDDALREELHNEVHARPSARIRLPVLIVFVAVLNEGVGREQECEHLRRLPGQDALTPEQLRGNFLRLRFEGYTLKWERHTEFTRYSIVQPLPEGTGLGTCEPALLDALVTPPGWLREIPGRTVAAIKMVMLQSDLPDQNPEAQAALMAPAQRWFGERTVVASQLGGGHSWALTDFHLRPSGFERMLVITPPDTSETRAGRISQRLFEIETYRLMALRGLPAVKALAPMLAHFAQAHPQLVIDLLPLPRNVNHPGCSCSDHEARSGFLRKFQHNPSVCASKSSRAGGASPRPR